MFQSATYGTVTSRRSVFGVTVAVGALVVIPLAACGRQEAPNEVPTPSNGARAVSASAPPGPTDPRELGREPGAPGGESIPFGLSAPDAFDLVATSDGALLVSAEPGACAQGLSIQRFGADGRARGARSAGPTSACRAGGTGLRSPVVDGRVTEIAAAAGGGRVGVAWIVEDGSDALVFAAHGDDDGERFSPTMSLGATVPGGTVSRARLQLTASEPGQLRVGFREPDGACSAHVGRCARYLTRPLPDPRPADGRGVEGREIPVPCKRMVAGGIWVAGTWYDGVCARTPESVTHVFAIRPEIAYAEAVPTLDRCEPLGVAPGDAFAVVWGRCDDGIAARTLSPDPARDRFVHPASRSLACDLGRPLARVRGPGGTGFDVRFDAPRARVEHYLPDDAEADSARAVWTGEALVVARPVSGARLRVEARSCVGTRLVPVSP
jgi:hypothetical protein